MERGSDSKPWHTCKTVIYLTCPLPPRKPFGAIFCPLFFGHPSCDILYQEANVAVTVPSRVKAAEDLSPRSTGTSGTADPGTTNWPAFKCSPRRSKWLASQRSA